ncbi:MAG: zinc-ribbon domain-containing protein [Pseudomonadota bacterium]
MKIACEACGAKYTIADDKVRGRKVKIRCKGCGTPIVVDGQHGGAPSISDAETDAALEPAEAPVIWSVNLSDTDSRTMSVEEIIQGYGSGLVTVDAFVWKDGMADWVPLLESELAPLLGPAPAADAPGTAAHNATPFFNAPNQSGALGRPAARSPSQPDNTHDLFGGADTAGAEEEIATSAPVIPQAGTSAYGDGSMTGARNENSVLFSLDALKAGFSPSAPAAKSSPQAPKAPAGAGRQQQISNPDDPFGMGAGNGLMNLGGPALFGADNQALLAAPAAPPPPPPATAAQVAAGAPPTATRPLDNKLVLLLGAGGGIVIIGLLLALLLGRKHDDSAPSADSSASASATPAPETLPATEAKKEEAHAPSTEPRAEAIASAAPSSSPATAASAVPDATKHADKAPTSVTKTGSTAPAESKKKEEPVPAGASDLPPFSKSSAISALTAASMSANACKKPGGPTGAGKATVTFAPSGRVTTATVAGGSYAGTSVGGCVASGFHKAHVPPFSGAPVTVAKSFQIN